MPRTERRPCRRRGSCRPPRGARRSAPRRWARRTASIAAPSHAPRASRLLLRRPERRAARRGTDARRPRSSPRAPRAPSRGRPVRRRCGCYRSSATTSCVSPAGCRGSRRARRDRAGNPGSCGADRVVEAAHLDPVVLAARRCLGVASTSARRVAIAVAELQWRRSVGSEGGRRSCSRRASLHDDFASAREVDDARLARRADLQHVTAALHLRRRAVDDGEHATVEEDAMPLRVRGERDERGVGGDGGLRRASRSRRSGAAAGAARRARRAGRGSRDGRDTRVRRARARRRDRRASASTSRARRSGLRAVAKARVRAVANADHDRGAGSDAQRRVITVDQIASDDRRDSHARRARSRARDAAGGGDVVAIITGATLGDSKSAPVAGPWRAYAYATRREAAARCGANGANAGSDARSSASTAALCAGRRHRRDAMAIAIDARRATRRRATGGAPGERRVSGGGGSSA